MPRFKTPREQILSAASQQEVERILSEAIGQVDPEELKTLPADCLEVVADPRTDLHLAAVTLLHCDLKHRGEEGAGELLRQVAELYAAASARVSLIEHRFPTGQ